MDTLFPSIVYGTFIWYFFYRPFHHKMPWANKDIVLKRKKKDWEE